MDTRFLWVGVGGFVGANARYAVGRLLAGRLGDGFPYATLLVNVSGSLAIGVVLTLLTERFVADPAWRLLVIVGFLGGYTTQRLRLRGAGADGAGRVGAGSSLRPRQQRGRAARLLRRDRAGPGTVAGVLAAQPIVSRPAS